MSDFVNFELANDRQIGLRFEEFPTDLKDEFAREIDSLTAELFSRIEAAMPSKSGMLRSRLRRRMFNDEKRVTGYIDVDVDDQNDIRKAAALEYGSRGKKVRVSTHAMRLGHYWEQRLAAPRNVIVQAYERTPNVAERKFLRGPLQAMRPEVNSRLNAVLGRTIAEAEA